MSLLEWSAAIVLWLVAATLLVTFTAMVIYGVSRWLDWLGRRAEARERRQAE